jgi:hypothetical protein
MSTVGTTNFLEDGVHKYFTMNPGDQYLRTFILPPSPATWLQMNVGVLYNVEATTNCTGGLWVSLTTSATPGVGIKQGVGAVKRMAAVGNGLAGSILGASTVWGNWTYSADVSGSLLGSRLAEVGTISASIITHQGDATGYPVPTIEAPYRKQIMMLGIYKSSTISYPTTYLICSTYTGNSNHNHTNNTLFSVMMNSVVVNGNREIDGVNQSTATPQSLAVGSTDDTNYPLDTINLYWQGSVPCRIYQIAVSIVTP